MGAADDWVAPVTGAGGVVHDAAGVLAPRHAVADLGQKRLERIAGALRVLVRPVAVADDVRGVGQADLVGRTRGLLHQRLERGGVRRLRAEVADRGDARVAGVVSTDARTHDGQRAERIARRRGVAGEATLEVVNRAVRVLADEHLVPDVTPAMAFAIGVEVVDVRHVLGRVIEAPGGVVDRDPLRVGVLRRPVEHVAAPAPRVPVVEVPRGVVVRRRVHAGVREVRRRRVEAAIRDACGDVLRVAPVVARAAVLGDDARAPVLPQLDLRVEVHAAELVRVGALVGRGVHRAGVGVTVRPRVRHGVGRAAAVVHVGVGRGLTRVLARLGLDRVMSVLRSVSARDCEK